FTQSVHVLFALQEALRELKETGGALTRHTHYKALTQRLMDGLAPSGGEILLESPAVYSSILTSYKIPRHTSYDRLHDRLTDDGFIIYAGQGQFSGTIFRIAVMGD